MKITMYVVMGVMLLMSISVVNANNLSEVPWDYAVPISPEVATKFVNISDKNNLIVASKIVGYQRLSRDGVKSFDQGKIEQLVISQGNNTFESYDNLSVSGDLLWRRNITTFRFLVQDLDSTISTDKIAVFVFYDENCSFVGYAWAYADEIETTSTYIKNVLSCYTGGDAVEPTDSSAGGSGSSGGGESASTGDTGGGDDGGGHDGGEGDPSDPGFG